MIVELIQSKVKTKQQVCRKYFPQVLIDFLITKGNVFYVALLLLALFHIVNNIVIILKDSTPLIADASGYYSRSSVYSKAILQAVRSFDFISLQSIFKDMPLNGQLLVFVAAPFYFILGFSHDTAVISNQIFFLVLILSIFGIGKKLFSNTVGFLAAFIISFYPAVFGFSRVYMLEFPMLAISTLCVYLLIKSDGFKDRKYSLFFGLACGLGLLLRPRFLSYIVVPVLFYVLKDTVFLFTSKKSSGKSLANQVIVNIFLLTTLLWFCILPWYSLDALLKYFDYQRIWSSLPRSSNIISTFLQYSKILFGIQLHWLFTFLFLAGSALSFFSKDKRAKVYFLFIWFILSLVIICSFGLKSHARLVVPLFAPIAIISSVGLEKVLNRKVGKYVVYVLLFLVTVQYFFISHNPIVCKKMRNAIVALDHSSQRGYLMDIFVTHGLLSAYKDDWKSDTIFSEFKMRRNCNQEFKWEYANDHKMYLMTGRDLSAVDSPDVIRILYIGFRGAPIHNEIEERVTINDLPIAIIGFYPDDFDYKNLFFPEDIQYMVLGADYVIRFKVEPIKSAIISQVNNIFDMNINNFEKLQEIDVPWGECEIYGAKIQQDE